MTIDTARGLGKAFYDRYYRNRRTRVVTQAEMTRRAALIVSRAHGPALGRGLLRSATRVTRLSAS